MAYKLIWSPAARDDLHDIVVFIARDNPNRAMSFGYELIAESDRLQEFPDLGRIVPEYRNADIREVVFWPYRFVYRVNREAKFARLRDMALSARNPAVVTPPISGPTSGKVDHEHKFGR
jgi:plasmid stabilization system protein ParE